MSFSSGVKDELSRQIPAARHCRIAETAAILSLCGRIKISGQDFFSVEIHTENVAVARKYFTLLRKTFNIVTDVSVRRNPYLKRNRTYIVAVKDHEEAVKILQATKLLGEDGEIRENLSLVKNRIVQNPCCRRAFIRGAFLAAGSISAPEKFYHFEIACASMAKAQQLKELIATFGIEAKIVEMENTLRNCVVVEDDEVSTDVIGVGNTVKVKNLTMKIDQTITIVGANETDPKNMKISSESPIGAALLGKRKGETVDVEVPAGVMKLKVLEISR